MLKHIYFCRHGLSEANKAGVYSGQRETPLSAEGREQARLAGEYAQGLHLDHIITSPFIRAHDTAKIIAKAIGYPVGEIELNSLLIERGMGSLEGTAWSPDFDMDEIADAETYDSLKNRVQLAYEYIQSLPAESVLVVSHGATGRMFRHVVDSRVPFRSQIPSERHANRFENGEIVQLV